MTLPTGGIRYFRKYLFDDAVTEVDWSLGMVRDRPRWQIPTGAGVDPRGGAYQLTDFFVDKPGIIYKRGGTSYQSSVLNDQTDVDIVAVAAPNYPGDPRVIAITSNGASARMLYDVTTATHASGILVNGAQPTENLSLYNDKLILTSGTIFYTPQKVYVNSTVIAVANLGGTPPVGICSCNHAGRFVIGHTSADPGKLYFSDSVDIENSWDLANAWFDVREPIMGLASINSVLLVFTRSRVFRITGSIPPGTTNKDMVLQPFANIGCIDARTIVYMNNSVYWANETGVYVTDGSADPVSLTNKSDSTGISGLWQSTLASFSPALGAVVCAGVYQNQYLLLSVTHNSGAQTTFLYYQPGESWVQLGNLMASYMFATSYAPSTELYFAPANTGLYSPPRTQRMSGMWSPASGNKNDASGTAVTPVWETGPLSDAISLKRYGFAHVTYDMRDAASDNPTLAVQIATGIEADSGYHAVAESPLAKVTLATRKRFTGSKDSQAVYYKFAQTNASSKTEIYALEQALAPYFVADGM